MRILFAWLLIAALSGCERSGPPTAAGPSATPHARPSTSPTDPAAGSAPTRTPAGSAAAVAEPFAVGEYTFTVPSGWQRVTPEGSMRLAQLRAPGDAGECTVVFIKAGGDAKSNIDRWAAQVVDASGKPTTPVTKTLTIAGVEVTTVELAGTYLDGMPGQPRTPRERWVFRGAIIPGTPMSTFIRMTGPAAAMNAHSAGWDALVASMTAR